MELLRNLKVDDLEKLEKLYFGERKTVAKFLYSSESFNVSNSE